MAERRERRAATLILLALVVLVTGPGPVTAQSAGETAVYWYEQGRRAFLQEDFYRAIENYKTALEISPVYSDPLMGLAEAYFSLQEFSQALTWAETAERYERSNLSLRALKGRILIGLGEYEAARAVFEDILGKEPYNEDALFGLAELDIARGRILDAQTKYREALELNPANRRALLSLALIFDARGEIAEAEDLIELALHHYPSNAAVQYLAARHYFSRNDLLTAGEHAERAIAINDNYPEAVLLKSRIHFERSEYDEVIPLVRRIISENRDNPYLWYLLGRSYDKEGDLENALQGYARAFRAKPDDEISRMSLEQMIIRETEPDDPVRKRYAEYHFSLGREYERRNYYLRALEEYWRGLRLAPFSQEGRLLYARIYRSLGHLDRYLSELEVLKAEGFTDREIEDDIEIYGSLLEDSLAREWNIRQYPAPLDAEVPDNSILLDRRENAYTVSLFYDVSSDSLLHPGAGPVIAEELFMELRGRDRIEPEDSPKPFSGFAEAFSAARQAGSNYFAVADFRENERVFSARMKVYRSATGTEITEYSVIRTGNGRVRESISKIAEHFNDDLPLRGSIVNIRFDTGLIDLGTWDGIEEEDKLNILRKGSLELPPESLDLIYQERDLLGTITITATDELISEGTIENALFFDMINPGDEVILIPETPEQSGEQQSGEQQSGEQQSGEQPEQAPSRERGASALELYRDILMIR